MRVYISGPIRDNEDFLDDFERGKQEVLAMGHQPVSPADMQASHYSYEDYMRMDILLMLACDGIYMLEGWVASKGANVEKTVAEACGLEVMYQ